MREKYMASKIPVVYALLFVLNVALYVVFEILVIYTLPQKLTPEVLAKKDSAYENCQVVAYTDSANAACNLIQFPDGSLELITTRRHDFSLNHYLLADARRITVPTGEEITVTVRFGIHTIPINVGNVHTSVRDNPQIVFDNFYIDRFFINHPGGNGLPVKYLIVGALLELLELSAYTFVKRNL